jgi:hypothetical protein
MRSVFGPVLTVYPKSRDPASRQAVPGLIRDLSADIDAHGAGSGLVAAFAPALRGEWNGRHIPIHTEVLDQGVKFRNTASGRSCQLAQAAQAAQARSGGIDQAHGDRLDDRLGLVGRGELQQHVIDVKIDGALGNTEDLPDLVRGFSFTGPAQHLAFA